MEEQYIGNLVLFAGDYVPKNCLACDGSLLPVKSYPALFSLLSNRYGGDGNTTFALPDFRGRAPIGTGTSTFGTNYPVGAMGGVENVALQLNQLPTHNHMGALPQNLLRVDAVFIYAGTDEAGATDIPTDNFWGMAPDVSQKQVQSYTSESNVSMASGALESVKLPPIAGSISLDNAGEGASHENRPPFTTLKWLIVYTGLYPVRE